MPPRLLLVPANRSFSIVEVSGAKNPSLERAWLDGRLEFEAPEIGDVWGATACSDTLICSCKAFHEEAVREVYTTRREPLRPECLVFSDCSVCSGSHNSFGEQTRCRDIKSTPHQLRMFLSPGVYRVMPAIVHKLVRRDRRARKADGGPILTSWRPKATSCVSGE
ncbi:hypothetical protein K466DRAFT_588440 [Polyporus arcularius HHB13444]|uniref:Uncharacterized protein n=1 Tax=Polyporus arcularius HHB13444 TaxID=1314778 RepID=A0A5C3P9Z1_9APHY|nr:hypothetical protein K466DRAFT_588440 [Polyporus arcularius HHB13444]